MTEKTLGVKLTELLWEHDPRITKPSEPQACAQACGEAAVAVAKVLGCIVATMAVVSNSETEINEMITQLALQARASTRFVLSQAMGSMQDAGHT